MKKILSAIMVLILILSTCALLASCASEAPNYSPESSLEASSSSTTSPSPAESLISFGKKYKRSDKIYYVFNEDGTGYQEYYSKKEYEDTPSKSYIQSGQVHFEWRETADGAVYLIKVKETYNKDHTEGKKLPTIINDPIYFAKDCFFYTTFSSTLNSYSNYRAILEGSELEKTLKKD